MKKKKHSRELTTTLTRAFFILTFAILSLGGLYGKSGFTAYAPQRNGTPVISTVLDARTHNESSDLNPYGFPQTSARALCLISGDSGELLYCQNGNEALPMASTTKIMTALVALERCSADSVVTVPREACNIEGSSVYLREGEKITVRDLLYGLMLESGNDAACALAIASYGSVDKFVTAMNKRARELGLVSTSFANPHGLPAENHYTTARELAKIAYTAMQNPLFREIVKTKTYTAKGENGEPTRYFSNHNRLLGSYEGTVGIKTGYTLSAGRCLVTSAERNGTSFIAVTLGDRNDFADHRAMYDFAFENFRTVHFAKKGEVCGIFGGVKMGSLGEIAFTVHKDDEKNSFDTEITLRMCSDFNNN